MFLEDQPNALHCLALSLEECRAIFRSVDEATDEDMMV